MGISKRLNQNLERPSRLVDFAVGESAKKEKLKFNVEQEISSEDWENMKKDFEFQDRDGEWLFRGMCLKILFPDRVDELGLEDKWEDMKAVYDVTSAKKNYFDIAYRAMMLKILYPEKVSELGLEDKQDKTIERYKNMLKNDNVNWWNVATQAANIKILYPEKVSELGLDNDKWENMKVEYEREVKKDGLSLAAEQAMRLKILFPERMGELDLESKWEEMKEWYGYFSSEDKWVYATTQAFSLKVISAKKVQLSNSEGLELIMEDEEGFEEQISPRPERLSYE